jgi:uncharacterized protein (TIGR02466 family)
MKSDLKILFGTPVWIFDLEKYDKQLNTMILMDGENFSSYVNEQKQVVDSKDFNVKNYDFLQFEGYGTEKLKNYITDAIQKIGQDMGWPKTTHILKTIQAYAKPLESDSPHHHPGSDLVGIYYVKTSENCGDLLLYETRGSVNYMWQDQNISADPQNRQGRISYRFKPSAGKLVMFPNYLFHSVETNLSNDVRISIVIDIKLSADEA